LEACNACLKGFRRKMEDCLDPASHSCLHCSAHSPIYCILLWLFIEQGLSSLSEKDQLEQALNKHGPGELLEAWARWEVG
jgi:hypothetical protein